MHVCTVVCGQVASTGLGEAPQAVAAHDQHVADPAVAQLGAHPGPELRALSGLNPDPEDVLDPVEVDPDSDVGGAIADLVAVADLHHQRVEVDDRVDLLKRPGLPRLDLLERRVGDLRDRLVGELGAQRALQMVADVAHGHPARVQRDDHLVEAAGAPRALRDQPRLERTRPVPRYRQTHRSDLGVEGLRGEPVA